MDLSLKGRKALITGGTKGIGRAIAETLAGEGCDIAFCARTAADVDATRAQLMANGIRATGRALDVRDKDLLSSWINDAAAELGGIDILVCNVSGGNDTGEASWIANFECDVMGAVRSVEAGLPYLQQSRGASIIMIASTAALEKFLHAGSYNAMKAAVTQYAGALAQELGPKGIRVNCVSPGPIYFEGGAWSQIEQHATKFYDIIKGQVALGRLGKPLEIAAQVALLASPLSGFTTGTNVVVDGGLTKRIQF